MTEISKLETMLNDFDPAVRWQALKSLASAPRNPVVRCDAVNMHVHTFYSYNAGGWSPSRVAWEAHRHGLAAAGIIDFDVLDGMAEFFRAGEMLGLRTCVGVETRVYYTEYSSKEIDSPGEPGVHYVGGAGFTRNFPEGTPQAEGLTSCRRAAQERNRALIARINARLPDIALDYDAEVLPRSPGHCPTERHIVAAYVDKAASKLPGERLSAFWSGILGMPLSDLARLLVNRAAFEEKVRARLVKRGGLGYEQPTARTFPLMEKFFAWVSSCDAVPMESWLDGCSEGEKDAGVLLEMSMAKGARALNIIPDRNWNIADPAQRAVKVENLRRIVGLAHSMNLPVNIGTEMNRAGLPYVDELDGPVLREFKEVFLRGALILAGHSTCARFAGFPYAGVRAMSEFSGSLPEMNTFFAAAGSLPAVTEQTGDILRDLGPERAYGAIHDAVKTGQWSVDKKQRKKE
jgi:hypothetical protein